jgi:hypothetical protein
MPNEIDKFASIEDLARTDPTWQKVLEHQKQIPQVKLLFFEGRFLETQVFVENLLFLHDSNREGLLKQQMRAAFKILNDPRLLGVEESEDPKEKVEFATRMMEKANREKIDKYRLWIINQALVIYCTILDTFLESIVDAIFRQNVKILYGVSASKNIDLKKLIDLGSVDVVIQEVRAKEVKGFSHDDVN